MIEGTGDSAWDSYGARTSTMGNKPNWDLHQYPVQSSKMEPTPTYHLPVPKPHPTSRLPKYIHAVQDHERHPAQGRTIVLCLDGTGDKFDSDNSNIVHIVGCLKKDDSKQVTYYQSGIGTYDGTGLKSGFSAGLDMAVGSGLGVHVCDAYKFLMQTYREGDKICIYGFSRGAYTARCLAGMLHKVGLLPAHNMAQVQFAYEFYKDDTPAGWKFSLDFKKSFCIDCSVYFMGLFDCVSSVGFIPRQLPFSSTATSGTAHFRHAIGLDEHRAKFKCSHWTKTDGTEDEGRPKELANVNYSDEPQTNGVPKGSGSEQNGSIKKKPESEEQYEKQMEEAGKEAERQMREEAAYKNTDVLEVWFMGAHADIGGGAVKNEVRHKLSNIPLRWMLRQSFECNTGIIFHTARLAECGLDVHMLHPLYQRLPQPVVGPPPSLIERKEEGTISPITRRSSALKEEDPNDKESLYWIKYLDHHDDSEVTRDWVPEQVEDHFDSEAEINDQLVQAPGWWVLEYWPVEYWVQKKDSDAWENTTGANRGRYRAIKDPEPNIHWTVHHQLQNRKYVMKGRMGRNAVPRIVV